MHSLKNVLWIETYLKFEPLTISKMSRKRYHVFSDVRLLKLVPNDKYANEGGIFNDFMKYTSQIHNF